MSHLEKEGSPFLTKAILLRYVTKNKNIKQTPVAPCSTWGSARLPGASHQRYKSIPA